MSVEAAPTAMIAAGMQQPVMRPILRCLPDRVRGMPIARDSFPLAAEIPLALFHDQERPNFLLRATTHSRGVTCACRPDSKVAKIILRGRWQIVFTLYFFRRADPSATC